MCRKGKVTPAFQAQTRTVYGDRISVRDESSEDSGDAPLDRCCSLISHKVLMESFFKGQFPHESVNDFFVITHLKK